MNWRVIQGDCLTEMAKMEAGSFDAVITDPQYGIGESGDKNRSRQNKAAPTDYGDFHWDAERANPEAIRHILRVSREQVIFGGNFYADLLPPSASWVVWDKQNTGDFADCELAWTSHKRAVRIFRYLWNGMIKARPEVRYHPTQKPLALMRWIVERYTNPGDRILDPFCGSGTTGVACAELGRDFVGIEIDPGYCAIARQRIEAATRVGRLNL